MSKTYNIEGNFRKWFTEHRQKLYVDILEAAEASKRAETPEVSAFKLRSVKGITECLLRTPAAVVNSLRKCETAFVDIEEYELAARSRDCGIYWNELARIYKEKS